VVEIDSKLSRLNPNEMWTSYSTKVERKKSSSSIRLEQLYRMNILGFEEKSSFLRSDETVSAFKKIHRLIG
jgi:hypothetical protein